MTWNFCAGQLLVSSAFLITVSLNILTLVFQILLYLSFQNNTYEFCKTLNSKNLSHQQSDLKLAISTSKWYQQYNMMCIITVAAVQLSSFTQLLYVQKHLPCQQLMFNFAHNYNVTPTITEDELRKSCHLIIRQISHIWHMILIDKALQGTNKNMPISIIIH
jgi:hypothetical protein